MALANLNTADFIQGSGVSQTGNVIDVTGGGTLDDLTDVTITTPSDGDVLTYDSGTGEWVNAAPTGGGGTWGSITGTLSSQTDLQAALDAKATLDQAAYWKTLPGTPTRTGNYTLTITDTSNANLYDLKFNRGTVLKWDDTTVHMAMVVSATYSSNTVTITIIGDVLSGTATMSSFKYALEKAEKVTFAYAGTVIVLTNISRKWKADKPYRVFGADGLHGTAGTTNATTYDINKNGTTFMTTKLSIASAATVGNGYTADDDTSLALNDVVSLDCDSVSTTAPIDAYVDLFIFPTYNQYL
jgi:hypothetical protein